MHLLECKLPKLQKWGTENFHVLSLLEEVMDDEHSSIYQH